MPVDEIYRDETIELDGAEFVGCRFEGCDLVYRGGELPRRVEENTFRDCRWRLEDAAGRTVRFMAALHGGLDGHGEKIVERTFEHIRGPSVERSGERG